MEGDRFMGDAALAEATQQKSIQEQAAMLVKLAEFAEANKDLQTRGALFSGMDASNPPSDEELQANKTKMCIYGAAVVAFQIPRDTYTVVGVPKALALAGIPTKLQRTIALEILEAEVDSKDLGPIIREVIGEKSENPWVELNDEYDITFEQFAKHFRRKAAELLS